MNKFTRRTVKVTSEHNDECKRLLKCMGIPYVEVSRVFTTDSENQDERLIRRVIGTL